MIEPQLLLISNICRETPNFKSRVNDFSFHVFQDDLLVFLDCQHPILEVTVFVSCLGCSEHLEMLRDYVTFGLLFTSDSSVIVSFLCFAGKLRVLI